MIYLSSFMLSNKQVKNPNIYPYNVFRGKYIEPFVFSPITVFYGNNGSGKSTLLNIIANKLQLKGKRSTFTLIQTIQMNSTLLPINQLSCEKCLLVWVHYA